MKSAFVVALAATVGGAVTSCGSEEEAPSSPEPDAVAPSPAPDDAAPPHDAGSDARDAEWNFDASPRAIVCSSEPCATSLTTTLIEGYCALLRDGTVACWGENSHGQLGRGADATPYAKATPERVLGLSNVAVLSRTCAIDQDGESWCWGRGAYFEGDAVQARIEWQPVKLPIPKATQIAPTQENLGLRVHATTCALVEGGLLCWGTNANAQLEPDPEPAGFFPPYPPPLPPRIIELPKGATLRAPILGRATLVLREDGTLWSWGAIPTLGRVSSLALDPYPQRIELTDVSAFDVNGPGACAVARGVAYCWGPAFFPRPPYSEGPLTRAVPERIETPEPLVRISTGDGDAQRGCGVGVSGDVYCWGTNAFGQAGDGTIEARNNRGAVKVVGLPAPAAEVAATSKSTCALLTTGKVYCWGDSTRGQLGNGSYAGTVTAPVEARLP